jgi:hypothetical protein
MLEMAVLNKREREERAQWWRVDTLGFEQVK